MERLRGKVVPPPLPLVRPTALPETWSRRRSEWGRQKVALAFSLAATLALFTVGWWAWPHGSDATVRHREPDKWAQQRDSVLRQVPLERVGKLVELASDVLEEASLLGDKPKQVEDLAKVFEQLVSQDLLNSANELTAVDRRTGLPKVVQRLTAIESTASRLANDWEQKGAASAGSLSRMAKSARVALQALARV
jgi:hypothetical protein